jgi:hypothetical protein
MKSKEEIEQLAIDYAKTQVVRGKNLPEWDDKTEQLIARYFTKGYTQCQEDNKDKKYTESQLRDAMEEAMVYLQNLLIKMPAAFSAGKLKQITEHVISLNKQD